MNEINWLNEIIEINEINELNTIRLDKIRWVVIAAKPTSTYTKTI